MLTIFFGELYCPGKLGVRVTLVFLASSSPFAEAHILYSSPRHQCFMFGLHARSRQPPHRLYPTMTHIGSPGAIPDQPVNPQLLSGPSPDKSFTFRVIRYPPHGLHAVTRVPGFVFSARTVPFLATNVFPKHAVVLFHGKALLKQLTNITSYVMSDNRSLSLYRICLFIIWNT